MERMRTIVFLLAVSACSMVLVSPGQAGSAPQDPVSTAGLAVQCDQSLCPCACSPLAGAWVAKLSSPASTVIQTFKFAPVNAKCTRFVVNSQASTRFEKVLKAFPEADDLTEFVGTACEIEPGKVDFTTIGYGVKKYQTVEKVVFIAVMSGCVELPKRDETDRCTCDADCNGDGSCPCCNDPDKDPAELEASVSISYFAAEQDKDRDGFPDTCDPVICVFFATKLKRVGLQPPCEPSESFVAQLDKCEECEETDATGRAIFRLVEEDQKMFFILTVKDLKDPTLAHIHVSKTPGVIGDPAVPLFPIPPDTAKTGAFTGLLSSGTFAATDFIGSLQGKTMADLVKAINEGRAFVTVHTKKFPKGEICGKIEDP